MNRQHVHIGTEAPDRGFERFVSAWEKAESNGEGEAEIHLNFEALPMLLAILTPCRLQVLKTLRQLGPLSVRALAKELSRNYKNVHSDSRALESAGLLERTPEGELHVPWDVIDAHFSLVAA